MKLSEADADLFFKLMWAVQFFVKQKLNFLPAVDSLEAYLQCSMQEKFPVREALYENTAFLDEFVAENPQQFSPAELAQILQWKHYKQGDFFIERYLKQYAIFMGENDQVYGVLGLYEGFDEILDRSMLPLRVRTVLLPFQDKIVYDGLLQPYNIYFGGGIKASLKEIYLIAKQQKEIITTFDVDGSKKQEAKAPIMVKDWQPTLAKLMEEANELKAGAGHSPLLTPAFALVKASLEFAQLAAASSPDADLLYKGLRKLDRALNKADAVFRRERY